MENVILIINLILALALVGIVLLQRSEGGGLGMGSGGGGGVMTGRGAATALSKATWFLATAFLVTSLALTIIAAQNSAGGSVLDRLSDQPAAAPAPATPLQDGDALLPPTTDSTDLVPTLE